MLKRGVLKGRVHTRNASPGNSSLVLFLLSTPAEGGGDVCWSERPPPPPLFVEAILENTIQPF